MESNFKVFLRLRPFSPIYQNEGPMKNLTLFQQKNILTNNEYHR